MPTGRWAWSRDSPSPPRRRAGLAGRSPWPWPCPATPARRCCPAVAGVVFSRAGSALAYRGLTVSDAHGTQLPAWLGLRGRQLLLHVQADGARYPLTVDPVIQQARLTATDGAAGDTLGTVGGHLRATGPRSSPRSAATINGHTAQGAVYVFTKPPTGWQNATQTAKLTARGGAAFDFLGSFGSPGRQRGRRLRRRQHDRRPARPGNCDGAPGAVYVFTRPSDRVAQRNPGRQAHRRRRRAGGQPGRLGGDLRQCHRQRGTRGHHQRQPDPGRRLHVHQAQHRLAQRNPGRQAHRHRRRPGRQPRRRGGDLRHHRGRRGGGRHRQRQPDQGAAYVFTKPGTGWHNRDPGRQADRLRRRRRRRPWHFGSASPAPSSCSARPTPTRTKAPPTSSPNRAAAGTTPPRPPSSPPPTAAASSAPRWHSPATGRSRRQRRDLGLRQARHWLAQRDPDRPGHQPRLPRLHSTRRPHPRRRIMSPRRRQHQPRHRRRIHLHAQRPPPASSRLGRQDSLTPPTHILTSRFPIPNRHRIPRGRQDPVTHAGADISDSQIRDPPPRPGKPGTRRHTRPWASGTSTA